MTGGLKRGRFGASLIEIGIFSAATNALLMVSPLYLLQVYDRVLPASSINTLIYISLLALAALALLGLLEIVRSYYADRVAARLDTEIGSAAFLTSMTGPRASLGDVQPLRDLATIRAFVSSRALFFLFDLPYSPIFIALLYLVHPILFYTTVIGAAVMVGVAIANQMATAKSGQQASDAMMASMNMAQSFGRNFETVGALGMVSNTTEVWGKKFAEIAQSLGPGVAPQCLLRRGVADIAHGPADRDHGRRRLSRAGGRDDGRHDLRCFDHLRARAAAARPDHRRLAPGGRCQPRLDAAEEHQQGRHQRDQGHGRTARPEGRDRRRGRHLFSAECRPHRRSADQEDQLPRRARRNGRHDRAEPRRQVDAGPAHRRRDKAAFRDHSPRRRRYPEFRRRPARPPHRLSVAGGRAVPGNDRREYFALRSRRPTTLRSCALPNLPRPTGSCSARRTAMPRRSARPACGFRAASASGSGSPAPSTATRR